MPPPSAGRLVRGVSIACFLLSFAGVATAVGAIGLITLPGFQPGSDPYPFTLAAPFAILSLMAAFAGWRALPTRLDRDGAARLRQARLLVGGVLLPLLVGLVESLGLGFLSSSAGDAIAALMLTIARIGIPLSLVTWLVAMTLVSIARAPATLTRDPRSQGSPTD